MRINNNFIAPEKILNNSQNINDNKQSFKNILNEEVLKKPLVQISKHANQRLNSRDINISKEQMIRVEKGINIAKDKGLKDTLILVDNIALVVNAKESIIVTAINREKQQAFTNIDGAVII